MELLLANFLESEKTQIDDQLHIQPPTEEIKIALSALLSYIRMQDFLRTQEKY